MNPFIIPLPKSPIVTVQELRDQPEATITSCVTALAAGTPVILIASSDPCDRVHRLNELGTLTGYRTSAVGLEFYFEPCPLAAAFGEKPHWIRLTALTKEDTP